MWTLKAMRVVSLLGSLYTTAFELIVCGLLLNTASISTCCFFLLTHRRVGTKEMSRLTGRVALQSVLSSERRSLT